MTLSGTKADLCLAEPNSFWLGSDSRYVGQARNLTGSNDQAPKLLFVDLPYRVSFRHSKQETDVLSSVRIAGLAFQLRLARVTSC